MMRVFSHRNIVEEVENTDEEITLKEARPVREALPLRLPKEMAEHAQQHVEEGRPQTNGR